MRAGAAEAAARLLRAERAAADALAGRLVTSAEEAATLRESVEAAESTLAEARRTARPAKLPSNRLPLLRRSSASGATAVAYTPAAVSISSGHAPSTLSLSSTCHARLPTDPCTGRVRSAGGSGEEA